MNGIELQNLNWDSKQLGISCGLIDLVEKEPILNTATLIESFENIIRRKNVKFITIKLSWTCIELVNKFIQIGGLLVDTELTFSFFSPSIETPRKKDKNHKFVFCNKIDSTPFLPISKEMLLSRFFLDPNIQYDKALSTWETSIKNHCEGLADELLVAYSNDVPCGLITMKFKNNKQLYLHIVGVLKQFQGKGIGKSMVQEIIYKFAKNYTIYVETQSTNIAAQRLYQGAGFKYHGLKYIIHYWQ